MLSTRRAAIVPFSVAGIACVVAGGLVAAATAPVPSEHGSWSAAYLVLVAGVAQVFLGAGQALLAPHNPSSRLATTQFACWNIGNAGVIAGTLTGVTAVVDAGGALLVVALALFVHGVRGATTAGPRTARSLVAYRLLVAVLLVGVAVGLVLARVLH